MIPILTFLSWAPLVDLLLTFQESGFVPDSEVKMLTLIFLTLEDVTHKLSRNVVDKPACTTRQPRRAKILTTPRRKSEISRNGDPYALSV